MIDTLFPMPFDKPLVGPGAVRTWSGMVCAAVVCKAMGWRETVTSGATKGECVPDAWDAATPVEIKGCTLNKYSGKSVIYKFRMEKEAAAYPELVYAFVGHPPLTSPATLSALHFLLSQQPLDVVIVPAAVVYKFIAETCDLKPVKTWKVNVPRYQRVGYNREGYSDGYYCPNVKTFFKDSTRVTEKTATHEGRRFCLNIHART